MNKQDIIREIANRTGMLQKDVSKVIEELPVVIKEAVAENDKASIGGFLTFAKKHIPAKSGVSKLHGVETAWETEEKDEIKVTLSKPYKAL